MSDDNRTDRTLPDGWISPADNFWDKVNICGPDECWEWKAGKFNNGYGGFQYKGKKKYAHRLAWEFANEQEIPDGMYVLHSCDNPPCCNPAHLRVGTKADNMRDMVERGRSIRGEKRKQSKLTEEDVREIRKRAASGEAQRAIAERFYISQTQVSLIVRGKNWSWLEENSNE